MKDRSAGKKEGRPMDRQQSHRKRAGGRQDGGSDDARRFSGDGAGERGYRGDSAPDLPPGSVPGGSFGAGGGYRQGDLDTGTRDGSAIESDEETEEDSGSARLDDFERGEWHDGFGVHGFRGGESASRQPAQRSGYGEQGFGAGESRGGRWGGGERGGYGGGQPGGLHGTRGGGWAAAGDRYEQGRGPRSYGPEGWGGRAAAGRPMRGSQGVANAPWSQSEFAGRGEFGDRDPGMWNQERGYSSGPAAASVDSESWSVPGPHTGRGPEGYVRAESAIREDVCERLTRHGRLDASRVQVRVENGEVTLDGQVESRAAKRMAEETAESVSGVRDVHNRLRIDRADH